MNKMCIRENGVINVAMSCTEHRNNFRMQVLEGSSDERDQVLMGCIGCLHRSLEKLNDMPGGVEFKQELGRAAPAPASESCEGTTEDAAAASAPASGMGLVTHIIEEILLLAGRGDATGSFYCIRIRIVKDAEFTWDRVNIT